MNVTSVSEGKIAIWVDWTPNGTTLTYSEVTGAVAEWGLNVNQDAWGGNIIAVNVNGLNKRVILMTAMDLYGRQSATQSPHTLKCHTRAAWKAIPTS